MTSRQQKDEILQEIRSAEIDFNDTATRDGVRRIASGLANLRFTTTSDCGMVDAIHNGAGALVDIRISEQALDHYDSQQMASVVEQTIQRGEVAVREMLREAAGHDGSNPAW